jgi:hypothetical protein
MAIYGNGKLLADFDPEPTFQPHTFKITPDSGGIFKLIIENTSPGRTSSPSRPFIRNAWGIINHCVCLVACRRYRVGPRA